ncbi:MAG: phosphoribosylglycinamide formyltransferase [Acidiferrobacterales bacterium]
MTVNLAVVVLISGRGSNLQSIMDRCGRGDLPVDIRAVISSRPDTEGLKRAARAGLTGVVVDPGNFPTRTEFEQALMQRIDACSPELVVLAGFMLILGPDFVRHYSGRLINIHPSLLPRFRGLNTHERALKSGARFHGASVHFVTADVDGGPVIIQAPVAVCADDSPQTLAARVLEEEHRILPEAIRWFAQGRLSMENGRALLDGQPCVLQTAGSTASPDRDSGECSDGTAP